MKDLFLNIITVGGWSLYKLNEEIQQQRNILEFEIKKTEIEFKKQMKICSNIGLYETSCFEKD